MLYETYKPVKRVLKGNRPYEPVKQTQQQYPTPVLHLPVVPPKGALHHRPDELDMARALVLGISAAEFVRRDNIIRETWLNNTYKTGEIVRPKSDDLYEKFGRLQILGVVKTYFDFGTESAKDWPASDRPLIISCKPDKGEAKMILCHPDTLARFYQCDNGGGC